MIFRRCFDELDTGSKEEVYAYIVFLFNGKLSRLVINDHHSDLSYSLNKIILTFLPYSLDL